MHVDTNTATTTTTSPHTSRVATPAAAPTVRPRTSATDDHAPVVLAVLADRAAAWDALLRLRVVNDRGARSTARTALRAAAHALAPSVKDDADGARAFVVRALLSRRRPAGLHPRRAFARAVLGDALCSADRREDDRGLRSAVASLAMSGLRAARSIPGALVRGLLRREADMRRGLDRLVAANLGLVRSAVSRHLGARKEVLSLTREDLEQEGALGLMHALRNFDPARGFALSTYAVHWIRHSITRAVADLAPTVRAPVGLVDAMAKVAAVRRAHPGEDLTVADLARLSGRTEARVRTVLERYPVTLSADAPANGVTQTAKGGKVREDRDGAGASFLERMEDPSADAFEVVARREMEAIARAELVRLTPREALVLRARYMSEVPGEGPALPAGDDSAALADLATQDGVPTFEAIGRALGVSRERVRQIESRAIAVVRRRVVGGGDKRRRPAEQVDMFA